MRTRAGYAGGTTPDPAYHRLGDHTESLEVGYDPSRISFERLLDEFWAAHDATAPAWSRQYMSAIWTCDAGQEHAAAASRDRLEATLRRPVLTEIRELARFHPAEDHHQKYYLRGNAELCREFEEMYPDFAGIVGSTAAARVNGFLGGEGSLSGLVDEIDRYGLTQRGRERLLDLARARRARPPVVG